MINSCLLIHTDNEASHTTILGFRVSRPLAIYEIFLKGSATVDMGASPEIKHYIFFADVFGYVFY
jgi:hypothetical protein